MQGGGGSRSTGKSRALDPKVILNSERSERDSGSDQCDRKKKLSSRGANESERRGDPVKNVSSSSGLPRSRWSLAMTPTESVLSLVNRLSVKKCAFTMAEILLSLTIIGVVAAITLPSLTGNINERTWNTQRKALYARFSQAIPLIDSLNTYTNAETFVTGALSNVLKINNICDNEHLPDCGIASKITTLDASTIDMPKTLSSLNDKFTNFSTNSEPVYGSWEGSYSQDDTDAAAFETQNGESIVLFYNPSCTSNMGETSDFFTQSKICLNFIYDLNGNKGPNTVGKDIGFITAFYPSDSEVVAPFVNYHTLSSGIDFDSASALCNNLGEEYRMPNILELSAMFMNQKLIGIDSGLYWSSSIISADKAQYQSFNSGRRNIRPKGETNLVRCVKR